MANVKKKTSGKNNTTGINDLNKKPRNIKNKVVTTDEVKIEVQELDTVKKQPKKTTNKNTNKSKKNTSIEKKVVNKKANNYIPTEKKPLTQEEIIKERKERNRKKYENQQKRFQEAKKVKEKKKVEIPEEVVNKKKKKYPKEEKLVKKQEIEETEEKSEEKERKEKRRFNHKSIHLTQTFINLKEKSINKINAVKEKTNDKTIPIGITEEENKKRSKRFIKEAIVYAIFLTVIDSLCIVFIDYFNFLRLFDVKALNIVVTVILCLIFNFFIAFMIDYFITKIWLRKKRKKKDDDINGDNWVNEEEYREDIENKEGE